MKLQFLCLTAMIMCTPVRAELMGMVPGRSANIPQQPFFSVEAGASWYTQQLQWSAVRLNFKPSRGILTYIDFAQLRASGLPMGNLRQADFSGIGFGGGVLFVVPDFFPSFDVAFKGAYHASVINGEDTVVRRSESVAGIADNIGVVQDLPSLSQLRVLDQSQWSAEFVVSPIDPVYENGLTWYSTLGYVSTAARTKLRASVFSNSSAVNYQQKKGAAVGVGIVKPFKLGQFYAGVEWLAGDPLLGVGLRHAFK